MKITDIKSKITKWLPVTWMKRHKIWTTIIIVVLVVLIYHWLTPATDKSATDQPAISLVSVERRDLREIVEVTGTISSSNYTQVQTQAIGHITGVYVTEGQTVREGDKMFELEITPEGKQNNQSAYSSYLSAKNNLESAQNQLNSLQVTLFKTNQYFIDHADKENLAHENPDWIMQWADWLAAEGSYKNQQQVIVQAQANVNSAYTNYRNTGAIVYAPATGTVENITAVEGMSFGSVNSSGSGVSLSARLATIKSSDQVLAVFNVGASDIRRLALDQPVTISGTNLPASYQGKIVSVDRYGTTSNSVTTYQVIARFDDAGDATASARADLSALLPNLSVDGEILVSRHQGALTVPTLAITTLQGHSSVTVQTADGQQTQREITIGIASGNQTEVLSGLSEGEQIVFSLPEFEEDASRMGRGMGGFSGGGGPGGGGPRN